MKNWIVFGVIFVIEVLLSSARLAGFPGPWRYYAYQWTVSYADGFTRRGLLGSLLRLLHLDNGDYLLIAVCGWLITFLLFSLVVKVLLKLLAPLEPMTRGVLMIALLLSPVTTGLLVQATGDPIQLILLVYIALTLFLLKSGSGVVQTALIFVVFGAASILMHEASLFFVGPALLLAALFVRRSGVDRAALLGYILGAAPTLLLTIHLTENHTAAAIAPMHLGSTQMVATSKITLDTFSSLLAEESAAHFHSGIRGYLLTIRNAVGTLLLPLFFALVMSHVMSQLRLGRVFSRRRTLFAFVLPLVLSSPLWMIAHDWGRFSSYLFLLTLTILSLNPLAAAPPNTEEQAAEPPSRRAAEPPSRRAAEHTHGDSSCAIRPDDDASPDKLHPEGSGRRRSHHDRRAVSVFYWNLVSPSATAEDRRVREPQDEQSLKQTTIAVGEEVTICA